MKKKLYKKPTNILIVLDGWGVAPKSRGNAIELAKKPYFKNLIRKYPYTTLNATGLAVGLSENQRSGSEAGHLNIGAGKIVKQDSQTITEDIESGKFFKNPRILRTINHALVNKTDLHFIGLLSDSDSSHSDPRHLYALLRLAKEKMVKQVYLHLFTDGRDTRSKQALSFLSDLDDKIKEIGIGKIATIGGRYYAMDRVKHWNRLQKAYDAIVLGLGNRSFSAQEAVSKSYENGVTDEFIIPTILMDKNGGLTAKVKDNDAVVFFNLRGDRGRQFTKLFVLDDIVGYEDRGDKLENIFMCTLADFGPDLPVQTAYFSQSVENALPVVMKNFKQLYIAEDEKYPHVTYFLNGGHQDPVGGESREKIASPDVSSYDQRPEMSSRDITKVIEANIEYSVYDFIAVNYANADMIGHTGNLEAAIKAIEFLDACLKTVVEKILVSGGTAIITADHGNADEMIDLKTGEILTMHSKNPVPFIIVNKNFNKNNIALRNNGVLGNVVPTLLEVLNVKKPSDMLLRSLIEK